MRPSAEDGESGLAGTTVAAEVLSQAVTGAGGAARAAAEVAKTAWQMAADSLKDYAAKAAHLTCAPNILQLDVEVLGVY